MRLGSLLQRISGRIWGLGGGKGIINVNVWSNGFPSLAEKNMG